MADRRSFLDRPSPSYYCARCVTASEFSELNYESLCRNCIGQPPLAGPIRGFMEPYRNLLMRQAVRNRLMGPYSLEARRSSDGSRDRASQSSNLQVAGVDPMPRYHGGMFCHHESVPGGEVDGTGGTGRHSVLRQLLMEAMPPAAKNGIGAITSVCITAKHVADELQCSICLEPFSLGESAKMLPCVHIYHGNCIERWIRTESSCPICRQRTKEGNGEGNA